MAIFMNSPAGAVPPMQAWGFLYPTLQNGARGKGSLQGLSV
jgi:hypothetical protein